MHRDVYPAQILLPGGRLVRKARVFATNSTLHVWTMSGRDVVKEEFTLVQPPQRNRATLTIGQRLELEIAEGTAYVNRELGCGCGSPLKREVPPYHW